MGNSPTTINATNNDEPARRTSQKDAKNNASNPEESRVFFLLCLIHRTWNVVVDPISKRARSDRFSSENATGTHRFMDNELKEKCLEDEQSIYGSEYSFCSCSYCRNPKNNPLFGRPEIRLSYSESKMSQKTALVIVSELSEELEVASPIDFLRLCNVKVTVAGLNGINSVKCARGLIVVPEVSLNDVRNEHFDVIIMPGGRFGSDFIAESEVVGEMLRNQDQRAGLIAGICGSPKALLKNRIGFGRKITSYPTSKEKLCKDYQYSEDSVVQDGNIITARGPAQALMWSRQIAENLVDAETLQTATKHVLLEL